MKYMLMFIDNEETGRRTLKETEGYMDRVMAWWGEHAAAGRIVGGEQLRGPDTATTVRHDGGRVTLVDGPFVEAKESVAGFALVEVDDLDAALDMARTWPWGGAVEVRPVAVPPSQRAAAQG